MNSTAYHSAKGPIVGRRVIRFRYGAVVAGIALAVGGAVTATGLLSSGDDANRAVGGLDRPALVAGHQVATDTMVTRDLGGRGVAGRVSGGSVATDTMVTRGEGG